MDKTQFQKLRIIEPLLIVIWLFLDAGCVVAGGLPAPAPTPPPSSSGYPRIESIGEQAIVSFDPNSDLPISVTGQDLGFVPDSAWSVRVVGVVQAIRGKDYDFVTFASSPGDLNVAYNKATILLKSNYLKSVHDGDPLTVALEISRGQPVTKVELNVQLAQADTALATYNNQRTVENAWALTNQVLRTFRLMGVPQLRQAPAVVAKGVVTPQNADTFIATMKAGLNDYPLPKLVTLASGARRFVLYSSAGYRSKFLAKRVPYSDIKGFPVPDNQVIQLLGPEVQHHFYVISLSFENSSDESRIINTGMINAYGRVLVTPTNSSGPSFTIPVEIPPQSSQQVYALVAARKPYTAREWIFRSLDFAGAVASGVATGFRGSPDLIRALGLSSATIIPGAKTLWPDAVSGYLQSIVNYSMPELVQIPQHSAKAFQLLYFSKDDLNGMISDTQLFDANGNPPKQRLAFLSVDTLEVPFEVSVQPGSSEAIGAPVIKTPPSDESCDVGGNASFTVVATGTAPISYQWLFNGQNIANATSPKLDISAVALTSAGTYAVKVVNPGGSVKSTEATLTVGPKPTFATPAVVVAPNPPVAGRNATFTVTATGNAPLSYQWYLNGKAIADATSSVLTLTSVSAKDNGSYIVTVSNPGGSITSPASTLALP